MTDPTNDPSTQPTTTPQPLDLSPAPAPAPAGANSQEQQATQASPGRAAPAEPEGHQQEGDAPHTIAASPGRLEAEAQRAALEDELEQTFRSLGLLPADTRVKKLLLENALGRRLEEGSPTPEELDRAIRLLASLAVAAKK